MNRRYTVKDHGDGKTYDVTEDPNGYPIYKEKEIDTDKLLAEARSLIEYNQRHKEKANVTPITNKTKRELELERTTKQWEEYYRNNPSKIRYNIFEELEKAFDY
jgi:hypothetical protein